MATNGICLFIEAQDNKISKFCRGITKILKKNLKIDVWLKTWKSKVENQNLTEKKNSYEDKCFALYSS